MIQRYILKKAKAHDSPKEITWHYTHSCDNISIVTHDYIPSKLELLCYREKGAEPEKKKNIKRRGDKALKSKYKHGIYQHTCYLFLSDLSVSNLKLRDWKQ